jgi:hypothetical protein
MACLVVIARSASDEAIHSFFVARWIASRSLSSGAHSRDPLARNDEAWLFEIQNPNASSSNGWLASRSSRHKSVFAVASLGYAGHASPFGLAWLRHA